MLEVRDLRAGYGETQVIHGVDIAVHEGRFHAILGRNGVGKTTTLKTIVGLLPAFGGEVIFRAARIDGRKPFHIARMGIAYVPETRDIFGSLSVLENLKLAARLATDSDRKWTVERVFEFFPNLANRRDNGGNQLSGGEQQMLAIGRALVMNPSLLILDEPTEGLAPIIVRQIFHFATRLADTASVFGRGQCVWTGPTAALIADTELHERWLGV